MSKKTIAVIALLAIALLLWQGEFLYSVMIPCKDATGMIELTGCKPGTARQLKEFTCNYDECLIMRAYSNLDGDCEELQSWATVKKGQSATLDYYPGDLEKSQFVYSGKVCPRKCPNGNWVYSDEACPGEYAMPSMQLPILIAIVAMIALTVFVVRR